MWHYAELKFQTLSNKLDNEVRNSEKEDYIITNQVEQFSQKPFGKTKLGRALL